MLLVLWCLKIDTVDWPHHNVRSLVWRWWEQLVRDAGLCHTIDECSFIPWGLEKAQVVVYNLQEDLSWWPPWMTVFDRYLPFLAARIACEAANVALVWMQWNPFLKIQIPSVEALDHGILRLPGDARLLYGPSNFLHGFARLRHIQASLDGHCTVAGQIDGAL